MSDVRVRIAPSPTGIPHIGNTRTALYNFLFARHHGGKFFVRIEDTDRERLVPESLPKIMEILEWLRLAHENKSVYVQSEHLEDYKKAAEELVAKKKAYYCFCTKDRLENLRREQTAKHLMPRYDRYCLKLTEKEVAEKLKNNEPYVIRLRVPDDKNLSWKDLVRGKITVNSNELDDQVLLKSDGFPTYHLGVVYDDNLMGITHVLRGAEWISSTPKHILLYEAFGFKKPEWGHLPLILGSDKSKLSKRHGAQSALDYRDQGYLPEALLNTILFWGWSPKDNKQFFTLDEMVQAFDIDGVNKNDPVVDLKKFDYFNGYYIRQKSNEELFTLLNPYIQTEAREAGKDRILKIIPLVKDRMKKLSEWSELTKYFFEKPDVEKISEIYSALNLKINVKSLLERILEFLSIGDSWQNSDVWQTGMRKIADGSKIKHGDIFMLLRIAIWGDRITPPLYETMMVLGKEESLRRIEKVI